MFKAFEKGHILSSGDSIDVKLYEPMRVFVEGYSNTKKVVSNSFEFSFDAEVWEESIIIDFEPIIGINIWVRPKSDNAGKIEVVDA